MSYDPRQVASFFDEYGEREWTRFEDGRTSPASLATHTHYLRRFVQPGDRVLDVGSGPGRFTIELARIGAAVVVADISPVQLELNRKRVGAAGAEQAVVERVLADVCDLAGFAHNSFDATVCYGGPLSYVLDRAPDAVAELARVTRPGGHVLVSVVSLVGAAARHTDNVVEDARRHGIAEVEEVVSSGYLPQKASGHSPMRLYRWRDLEALLAPHGEIVAASACDLLRAEPDEAELRELLARLEIELGSEPGALDAGSHILAVLRV